MVPVTCPADLDDVDRELRGPRIQPGDLVRGARRPGGPAEGVPEYPGNQRDLLCPADRAALIGGDAVELSGPEQIRVGIADFIDAGLPGAYVGQLRALGQRVLHDPSMHEHQRSRGPPPGRM